MQDELYVRVKQALTWLKRNKGILQKDIADKMGMAEASFTRALSRVKEKNDKDFVISFHSAVKDFISLDYLLDGKGNLLVENEKAVSSDVVRPAVPAIDPASQLNATIAAYIEAVSQLKERIKEKDATIAEKDERIAELKAHNRDLRQQLNKYENSDIDRYPFPIGVSDGNKRKISKTNP